jgi:hypothetical protein
MLGAAGGIQRYNGMFAGAQFLENVVWIAMFQERRDERKVKAGGRDESSAREGCDV